MPDINTEKPHGTKGKKTDKKRHRILLLTKHVILNK